MNESTKDTTQQEAELEMLISDILRDIGIPCNLLGYRYVRTAIMLAVENQGYIDSVVKGLYPEALCERYKLDINKLDELQDWASSPGPKKMVSACCAASSGRLVT